MAKSGRKQKPDQTSWGAIVPGLARDTDGRWRVVATGKKYTEPEERLAVAHFRRLTGGGDQVEIEVPVENLSPSALAGAASAGAVLVGYADGHKALKTDVGSEQLWAWLRQQLLTRPEWVGQKVGIPQLASLRSMDLPKPSIKLQELVDLFRARSESGKPVKTATLNAFQELASITGAKTLAELTTEKLMRFREHVVASGKKPGTVAACFGRSKWLISFAKKWGLDTRQIDDAIPRLAVLHAPKNDQKLNPQPVDVEAFMRLLRAANDHWRAVLLLGLNCCRYLSEVLSLQWDEIDLTRRTLVTRRGKTKVIRAAVLWPDTIEAINKLRRTASPYIFVSRRGTKFNPNGQWKAWRQLNGKAQTDVTFDQIRDGAYTTAMEGADDERKARVLAGHRAPGLTDNYVARNPAFVASAVNAIHRRYFKSKR